MKWEGAAFMHLIRNSARLLVVVESGWVRWIKFETWLRAKLVEWRHKRNRGKYGRPNKANWEDNENKIIAAKNKEEMKKNKKTQSACSYWITSLRFIYLESFWSHRFLNILSLGGTKLKYFSLVKFHLFPGFRRSLSST